MKILIELKITNLDPFTWILLQAGGDMETVEVTPNPAAPKYTPLKKVDTISHTQVPHQGIVVECMHPKSRNGRLFARTNSVKFNSKSVIYFSITSWFLSHINSFFSISRNIYIVQLLRNCTLPADLDNN